MIEYTLIGYDFYSNLNIAANILSLIIIACILKFNSFYELKFRKIDYTSIFLMLIFVTFIYLMKNNIYQSGFLEIPLDSIIGALIGFTVFFILKLLKKNSAGDIFLMSCLGFCMGINIIPIILFYFIVKGISIIIYSKQELKEYIHFHPIEIKEQGKEAIACKIYNEIAQSLPSVSYITISWYIVIIYNFIFSLISLYT